ncbi:MAG: ACP S-malonyltransferase [Verrucomicrobiota bacterium]|nr:ACP S-malonyltransferase [Verrucomicrobiota bacterium]
MPINDRAITEVKKPVVLLFAGQGAQEVGMGLKLVEEYPEAKKMFDMANERLGFNLNEIMFEGPDDELTKTSVCQPALYLHGLATWEILKSRCPDLMPVAAAGLSLGEFTAYSAAGAYSFERGLDIVSKRGQYMESACNETKGSMAAVIGGDEESVQNLASEFDLDVANYNAPGQIVISGEIDKIKSALEKVKEYGARMGKELVVAGAYHSRLMVNAQNQLADELKNVSLSTPLFPVISNVEANEISGEEEIKSALERQVTGSVRWSQSMEFLIDQGHELFIEFSPKPVLAGLMARIKKGTNVISVGDPSSIDAAVESLS